jgi:hypothetical protein
MLCTKVVLTKQLQILVMWRRKYRMADERPLVTKRLQYWSRKRVFIV